MDGSGVKNIYTVYGNEVDIEMHAFTISTNHHLRVMDDDIQ